MGDVRILFEDGRVRLSTEHGGIWTTEGEALMLAHALIERLASPSISTGRTVKLGDVVSMPSPASKPFAPGRVTGFQANEISFANPRLTWPKGYGPGDGNAEWDYGND